MGRALNVGKSIDITLDWSEGVIAGTSMYSFANLSLSSQAEQKYFNINKQYYYLLC